MTENLVILGIFDYCSVRFIKDEDLDKLEIGRKLGYLVNHDGTVLNRGIFSHGVARRDFPELFKTILSNRVYGELWLKYLEVYKRRIDFVFGSANEEAFKVGVPLDDTSGELQVHEGKSRIVSVKWENGLVTEARRAICQGVMSVAQALIIPDDEG